MENMTDPSLTHLLPAEWRVILSPPARGAWNMAADEAILEATGSGTVAPTLRLYAWQPACLSLGYAQPITDVDHNALAAHGWDVVRRPTGGRAILHTDELTYSVSGPAHEPRLAGSVLESYRRLSTALLQALHLLDIPALALSKPRQLSMSMPQPSHTNTPGSVGCSLSALTHTAAPDTPAPPEPVEGDPASVNPVCFEVPSNYEITVYGKKLIGSAQARRKEGVLQHGSLPLYGDLTRITQALVFPDEIQRAGAAARLAERAMTAETILGYPLDWECAAQAFIQAFQETLNLTLIPSDLTPAEKTRAEILERGKYSTNHWTVKQI